MDERLSRFTERAAQQNVEVHVAGSHSAVAEKLAEMAAGSSARTFALQGRLLAESPAHVMEGLRGLERSDNPELVISEAEFGIADTGSVVVQGGRGQFSMAAIHVVLLKSERMIDTVEELFRSESLESPFTIITGPSRTADIERVLVLGAHGAVRMAVIIDKR